MFAKLMVVATDRAAAIERMRRALAETRIAGVQTTVPFHRWLFERDEFNDETGAGLSTDLIARTWEPAPLVAAAALRAAELAALASLGPPAMGRPASPNSTAANDEWWSTGVREVLEDRL
jgi:acetyl/propionyl-CoA carboxylase alpha subunit